MRGFNITNIKTVTTDYTEKLKGVQKCPRCNRMAYVKDDGESDYIYYQHKVTKAYGNGTLLNTYSDDECKFLA